MAVHSLSMRLWGLNSKYLNIREHWCLQIIFWVFLAGLYLNCQKWDSVKSRNQCSEQPRMYPVMACLRAERWKLLSWALQVQGWPKSFPISIKRRQLATRNSSSSRINIGTPRNNLPVGIEALKIILWLVNPKFSCKSSSWHNQEGVKVSIFLVNIKTIIPGSCCLVAVSCLPIHPIRAVLATHLLWY